VIITQTACNALSMGTEEYRMAPSDVLQDRSLFTGEPCLPPCWYGLHVGESNYDDVLTIVNSLSFIDADSIKTNTVGYNDPATDEQKNGIDIKANCKIPIEQNCLIITVVDNVLREIGSHLNYNVSLGEISENLGPPDFISITRGSGKYNCQIGLIWVNVQVVVYNNQDIPDQAREICTSIQRGEPVSSQLLVEYIVYYDQNWIRSLPRYEIDFKWPGFEK